MPVISPIARFWISLLVTAALAISQGTIHLTHAIPGPWIEPVVAWAGIIATLGSAFQAAVQALGLTTANRIASAAKVDGVQKIEVDESLSSIADAHANVVVKP